MSLGEIRELFGSSGISFERLTHWYQQSISRDKSGEFRVCKCKEEESKETKCCTCKSYDKKDSTCCKNNNEQVDKDSYPCVDYNNK